MYQSKHAGRNALRFFDQKMQESLNARTALETELRRALERGQLKPYYQVQVNAKGRPEGVEVLLRWLHPELGPVPPAQFIPLAEETGLIVQIGAWVLDAACAQIKQWQGNPLFCNLVVAVNISAEQFYQQDFVERVQSTIQKHGINAMLLKLELTESLAIQDIEAAILKMQVLKEIGVSFALDDFGTGFSSLSYLKRLPLDQIKVDQSFVRNITSDNADKVMVMAITGLGMNFELNIIAEGVETEAQFRLLHRFGCETFQGYLFSKPVPVEQFEEWVIRRSAQAASGDRTGKYRAG
jgi:EAL domain-containing protein (putative c-di-GMP-specific phosphodiesterase class I)